MSYERCTSCAIRTSYAIWRRRETKVLPNERTFVDSNRQCTEEATSDGITVSNKCLKSQLEFTDDFYPAEREASARIISYDTGFYRWVLGCSISGQRCSAGHCFLYTDSWFPPGHAEPARFRPGFIWR